MVGTTPMLEVRGLSHPDDMLRFHKGRIEMVRIGGAAVARATFEPGWKWSECEKQLAGTELCEMPHTGYVVSGRLAVQMADGTEVELRPGDAVFIPPGHDGWVMGDEPVVMLDFGVPDASAEPTR
jgi:ethanolamine utilization protein EutQ (cupin superfamily)